MGLFQAHVQQAFPDVNVILRGSTLQVKQILKSFAVENREIHSLEIFLHL